MRENLYENLYWELFRNVCLISTIILLLLLILSCGKLGSKLPGSKLPGSKTADSELSAGKAIDEAENGRQAIDIFTGSPEGYYDILLMDIQMPVLGGKAVGMNGHLAKPIDKPAFMETVGKIPKDKEG